MPKEKNLIPPEEEKQEKKIMTISVWLGEDLLERFIKALRVADKLKKAGVISQSLSRGLIVRHVLGPWIDEFENEYADYYSQFGEKL